MLAPHQAIYMKWGKVSNWRVGQLICALCLAVVTSGCVTTAKAGKTDAERLVLKAKHPKQIELMTGRPSGNFRELGIVESSRAKKLTPEVTSQMMSELQQQASMLRADAVIEVRRLADRHEGFVNNPRTPFPSVMQGEWKTYFFRGTAVKYLNR